jgi:hypothetical protein
VLIPLPSTLIYSQELLDSQLPPLGPLPMRSAGNVTLRLKLNPPNPLKAITGKLSLSTFRDAVVFIGSQQKLLIATQSQRGISLFLGGLRLVTA